MSGRGGCLLLGAGATPALPGGLPALDPSRVHPVDRGALTRAQAAAQAAARALARPDVPDVAVADLTARLGGLLGVVHRIGSDLLDARAFLDRNAPDRLARERADLELRRLGAAAAEVLALREAEASLAARAALADRVHADLGALEARLAAAGQELEAFRARVEARGSSDELGHELDAYRRSADLALEAYERTRAELR